MNSTVYAPKHEDWDEPQGPLLLKRMNLYSAKIAVVHDRFKQVEPPVVGDLPGQCDTHQSPFLEGWEELSLWPGENEAVTSGNGVLKFLLSQRFL